MTNPWHMGGERDISARLALVPREDYSALSSRRGAILIIGLQAHG